MLLLIGWVLGVVVLGDVLIRKFVYILILVKLIWNLGLLWVVGEMLPS
jgi:hypothetical protein